MKFGDGVGTTANGSRVRLRLLDATVAVGSDISTSFVLKHGMELGAGRQEQVLKNCRNSKRILPWGQVGMNIEPLNPQWRRKRHRRQGTAHPTGAHPKKTHP